MKKIILLLLLLSNFLYAEKTDILGKWIGPVYKDGNQVTLEVYEKENGKFYGKVVDQTVPTYLDGEYQGQEKMDLKNPDPNLRERKILGLELLEDLVYNKEENEYEKGQLYVPGMGKTLHTKIKIENEEMVLKASFDRLGWFSKTQIWKKVP